jgi:uncharacterized membrane protein YdjX (TVP38/TMEM64 family)
VDATPPGAPLKLFIRRAEAALIFAASFALAALVVINKAAVSAYLAKIGIFSYPLAVLIFAIVASAPFSVTDAIAVMNGVVFGPLWGSVVNAVGLVAAAIVGYTIALRTSKLLDIEANVARLPAWARHFRLGSWQFLLTVRIIPGLGGTIATQTAAALRVPLFRHVWTMCAIAVPICTLLAVTGNGLANVLEARVVVPTKKYFYDHRQHQRISPSPTASQP